MSNGLGWLILVIAGLLEVAWAIGLKASEGFTRIGIASVTIVAMVASMVCLGIAMKALPLGTAYAIWTGIGTIGTAILGIALFNESCSIPRVVCLSLIVIGVIGLRLVSTK